MSTEIFSLVFFCNLKKIFSEMQSTQDKMASAQGKRCFLSKKKRFLFKGKVAFAQKKSGRMTKKK